MDVLWLGYDNVSIPYAEISAVLYYRPDLDARITDDYGFVPSNIRAVVVTQNGVFWPSSWQAEHLHKSWVRWRDAHEL
jgi:hypothetical protein